MFIGVISNDPGIVTNVEYGQEWKIKKEDISDWMYTRGDKIYGGYTIDPLLVTYPKEEADEGSDSNLLIVFYIQIMPDDLVMQLHRF